MLGRRSTLVAALGVAAVVSAAGVPGAARAERPRFGVLYDCTYTTFRTFAAPDIVLRRNRQYQVSARRRGRRLVGRVASGTYRLRGQRIVFLTGRLAPPPGVAPSYYDPPHNRLQVFQLRPATVPWDCVIPGTPDLTR